MVNGDEAITFWLQYNGQDFEKQKKEIKELIPSWNVFLRDQ